MPARSQAIAETRARIEEAAVRLFGRKGFHGTGMREIAEEAGVSVGTIYNHHATKEELFAALMEGFEAAYTADDTPLARALRSFEDLDDLEAVGEASRAMVGEFTDYIRLIYVDVVELEGTHIRRLFGGMRGRYEETLGDRLDELQEAGRIGGVDPVAGFMTATIVFFYLFNIERVFGVDRLFGMDDDEAIRTIATVIRDGMRPR